MRTEQEMMDIILAIAKKEERIRIVTLEGSRANVNISKDEFQDYDITYFVKDMESFTKNDEWLNQFGNITMMQKPEGMKLFSPEETGFSLSVGKNYKYIDKDIDKDLWNRLLSTYRVDSYKHVWESLFTCHELFREVSKEVAELLGFVYPEYDKNITRYTQDMYNKYVEKRENDNGFDGLRNRIS